MGSPRPTIVEFDRLKVTVFGASVFLPLSIVFDRFFQIYKNLLPSFLGEDFKLSNETFFSKIGSVATVQMFKVFPTMVKRRELRVQHTCLS